MVAERMVRTQGNEWLDHPVVPSERHPRWILRTFGRYDSAARPHRIPSWREPQPTAQSGGGPVRSDSVLGGLHHVDERAA